METDINVFERFLKNNDKYNAIIKRARSMELVGKDEDDESTLMDLESADHTFHLRLEEFLNADDFNFAHDFLGIGNNIVRDRYPSENFGGFLPRFSGK